MLKFEIVNELKYSYNTDLIKKTIKIFSDNCKQTKGKSFTLVFAGTAVIRKLNLAYRGKDKATDVLSFVSGNDEKFFPDDANDLGEILICLTEARKQAKKYGWSIDYEIVRLLVHGLSHLVGYDHENVSQKKAEQMEKFEKKIIDLIFDK